MANGRLMTEAKLGLRSKSRTPLEHSRRQRIVCGMAFMGRPLEDVAKLIGDSAEVRHVRYIIDHAFKRMDHMIKHRVRLNTGKLTHSDRGVYVACAVGMGAIKIGWSDDIPHRIRSLNSGVPANVILIGTMPFEGTDTESAILSEMSQWRIKGEWFRFTPDSREFICNRFKLSITDEMASCITKQVESLE